MASLLKTLFGCYNNDEERTMLKRVYGINEITTIIAPICESYGVGSLALIGSYARGDATAESDIDLLIYDKGQIRGLFQLAGFHADLEERLGVSVDLLTEGGLDEGFLANARTEEVLIYESKSLTA